MQCFSSPWHLQAPGDRERPSLHTCNPICNSCWIKPKPFQQGIMLALLSLLRAWAISRDAHVAAFRESLICSVTSRARGSALDIRGVPSSTVPVWSQGGLQANDSKSPPGNSYHPAKDFISWPKTEFLVSATHSPFPVYLFIHYLLHDLASKEFRISSMNSSEQHFEKALHWFCRLS